MASLTDAPNSHQYLNQILSVPADLSAKAYSRNQKTTPSINKGAKAEDGPFHVKILDVSDILFRRLAPSDVATYRNIRLESLKNDPDNYGSTFEEESKSPQLVFEKYILEQTPGNRMYGAFDGDSLIGISGFFGDTRQRVLHRAKVTQVYLDPAYRGQGIAKKLLIHLIEEAFKIESLESLQLEAVDSNKTAVGLYKSLGFVSYGRFENYFKKLDGTYLDQQFMVLTRPK